MGFKVGDKVKTVDGKFGVIEDFIKEVYVYINIEGMRMVYHVLDLWKVD